ncbi:hypothetical protein BRADI_3g08318v3 [Brachypodium distachyon]|uniref:Uncharacterized protein n=1 Tax=Brachypodium distachyon TaxID=15368 RepID=A0A2K2CVY8_BRADI|nr:hypothetical protein BRADI_3g08318v3 [Brachypodium distachyon]
MMVGMSVCASTMWFSIVICVFVISPTQVVKHRILQGVYESRRGPWCKMYLESECLTLDIAILGRKTLPLISWHATQIQI